MADAMTIGEGVTEEETLVVEEGDIVPDVIEVHVVVETEVQVEVLEVHQEGEETGVQVLPLVEEEVVHLRTEIEKKKNSKSFSSTKKED